MKLFNFQRLLGGNISSGISVSIWYVYIWPASIHFRHASVSCSQGPRSFAPSARRDLKDHFFPSASFSPYRRYANREIRDFDYIIFLISVTSVFSFLLPFCKGTCRFSSVLRKRATWCERQVPSCVTLIPYADSVCKWYFLLTVALRRRTCAFNHEH